MPEMLVMILKLEINHDIFTVTRSLCFRIASISWITLHAQSPPSMTFGGPQKELGHLSIFPALIGLEMSGVRAQYSKLL